MSYQDAVGVVLGVLIVLLCDGLVCELIPELYDSDNGTSDLADIAEASPDEDMEPIFVHVGAQKVTIPCKPAKTDFVIGMNPTYSWTREDGETSSVIGDDFLTLPKFHADDSGHYSCTVSFQKEGQTYTKKFYHTVMGYHIRGELQVLLIFQTSSCDRSLTSGFMKTLYEHLTQVVAHLHCELLPGNSTCFPTLEKPLDEFNLQVELKVSPFGKDWDESCKIDALSLGCYRSAVQTNLQQAKEAITKFMEKNKRFPLGESVAPQDTFVNTFFSFLEGGKCQRGYGQIQELQAHCPDCCTLCPPGTHSEATVDNCVLCPIGSYSPYYGATSCNACHHNWLTVHPGARRAGDCRSMKVPTSRRFSVLMVAFSLPPLGCLCLIVLFCYCFRRRWQKRDSTTKDEISEQEEEDMAFLDSQEPDFEQSENEGVAYSPSALEELPEGVTSLPVSEVQDQSEEIMFDSPELQEQPVMFPPPSELEEQPERALFASPELEGQPERALFASPELEGQPERALPASPEVEGQPEGVMLPSPELEEQPVGVMLPSPELEEPSGGVLSSTPPGPEEQAVMENVVFPPSSPISDAESA